MITTSEVSVFGIAQSPTQTNRWFTTNFGHFERCFSDLVGVKVAKEIVTALRKGEDAEFPSLYEKEQFDYGFLYMGGYRGGMKG